MPDPQLLPIDDPAIPPRSRLALGEGLPAWEEFLQAAARSELTIRWLGGPREQDLAILNYTARTVYERRWNSVTRLARGLIVRPATGEIVALPLAKFGNLGED